MREILFRGKRVDNSEVVEGVYYKQTLFYGGSCVKHYIITSTESLGYDIALECYEVAPETVGQYTGLTDKNGKKIFEGDIVNCGQDIQGNFIDRHVEIGYVEMKHGAFGLHRKQGWYRPFKDWLEDYEYEIIGNIHDNPELLKGGSE